MFRACQATTPFMFDMFLYYVVLKYGLVELYALRGGGGNVTAQQLFRGWPVVEQECCNMYVYIYIYIYIYALE